MEDNIPNVTVNLVPMKKDHYSLRINFINLGTFERSEIRHIIEQLDKAANH